MGKPELNPLKKWVLTNKFYIKTTEKDRKADATHFLLDGGIWGIPKDRYSEFLHLLATDLQNNEKHYICENRTKIFRFICDIDMFEDTVVTTDQISRVVRELQEIVKEYYSLSKVIICGADSKTVKKEINGVETELIKSGFHLVWPDIWISVENAKKMRLLFIEKVKSVFGERESWNSWEDVIDLAVYEDNGLRMVGCRKMGICKSCKNKKEMRETCLSCENTGKKDENRVYLPKLVLDSENVYFTSLCNYSVMVYETSIYNYRDIPETKMIKNCSIELEQKPKKRIINKKEDDLLLKIETFIHKHFKEHHSRSKIVKLTKNESCYYIEPDDNYCMNVGRNHSSSSIFFQIKPSGISQRCYCKKEATEGKIMCKHYSSPEIPLTKVLCSLLFGTSVSKKLVNVAITKSCSSSFLDISLSSNDLQKEKKRSDKEICLVNCKNILSQIENRLLKK